MWAIRDFVPTNNENKNTNQITINFDNDIIIASLLSVCGGYGARGAVRGAHSAAGGPKTATKSHTFPLDDLPPSLPY